MNPHLTPEQHELLNSGRPYNCLTDELLSIQTFYEKNFRAQGIPITYLAFRLDNAGTLVEPDWDQEPFEQTYKTLTRS